MSKAMQFAVIPGALMLVLAGCGERKAADTGAAMDTTMAASTTPATPATEAPPAELRSRSDAFGASWNQENADAVGAFYATDATLHDHDSTYTGRADIVKRWVAPGLPMLSDLSITNQAFAGSGDTMTETGSYTEMWSMPKMAPKQHGGTYSITWSKVGSDWMVKEMTVNDTTTAAAPAPKS